MPLTRSWGKTTVTLEPVGDCRLQSRPPLVLTIAASLRRAGKGVRLIIGNGSAKAIDDGLVSLIARAIATRNMLLAGSTPWRAKIWLCR
jgi:hypothetical protein